jgi:hypothetical protein
LPKADSRTAAFHSINLSASPTCGNGTVSRALDGLALEIPGTGPPA